MPGILQRQAGVALISVLLVFALAALIGSEVMLRNYQDIRKTANLVNHKQAYHYALSGEQFARQILYRDFIESQSDNLAEIWALQLDPFEIEQGSMTIEIRDLQGLFNINNMVTSNGSINQQARAQFQQLLAVLDIDENFTAILADWLDQDTIVQPQGAEDESYLEAQRLAANRPATDRSELRLLKGLGFEDYEKLKSHIVALPKTVKDKQISATKYNLNTLDAKLLEVLGGSDTDSSNTVTKRQQQGGYDSLDKWLNSSEGQRFRNRQNELTVRSEFFEVQVTAIFDERVSIIRSQLYRDANDGSITVIKRQQGME
jgi:general secretion pathway protein K